MTRDGNVALGQSAGLACLRLWVQVLVLIPRNLKSKFLKMQAVSLICEKVGRVEVLRCEVTREQPSLLGDDTS